MEFLFHQKELIKDAHKESISVTHRHMLSVLNTMLNYEKILLEKQTIRILDAGCGNGMMIYFLNKYLPLFNTKKSFIIYGYDLLDHGVQEAGYAKKTFSYLQKNFPEIDWVDRIRLIKSDDNWPFENESFDFVVSNQVLEHVWDHYKFFKEQNRVLYSKGFSHHIFPVREVIFDGHIFLPKVHKLKSWDAIYSKVKFYSSLNLGIYRKQKKEYNNDLDYFSRVWADKIYHYCNYPSYADLNKTTKQNHLCLTTRYTFHYYWRKFREVIGLKPDFIYNNKPSSSIIYFFLKHISGISIVLYKGEYSKYNQGSKESH